MKKFELSSRKIAFFLMFSLLSLLLYQFNFSAIIGVEGQQFTLFQFVGPIAGGILSPVAGIFSVLVVELTNFLLAGKAFDLVNLVRLFPMAFAAFRNAIFNLLLPFGM